jgi:hypothetical protein
MTSVKKWTRRSAAVAAACALALTGVGLQAPRASANSVVPCSDGTTLDGNLWYHFDWGGQQRAQYLIENGPLGFGWSNDGFYVPYRIAIKDTNADGYPPYFYLRVHTSDGLDHYSGWKHNTLSAAGGWQCYQGEINAGNQGHPTYIDLVGSVDNAPQIPEILLTRFDTPCDCHP